jgi:NAD(P)H-quinone oxidoreductase subunit 5
VSFGDAMPGPDFDALPALSHFAIVLPLMAAMLFIAGRGARPGRLPAIAEMATLLALVLAASGGVQFLVFGARNTGIAPLVLTLDGLSATMTVLVAFVGWVAVRYSRSYLDGEAREGRFHGLMLSTLAAVLLLVQAGDLVVLLAAFVMVGITLRQLLLFYPERREAQRAATKFSSVWGAGDIALALAVLLIGLGLGATDIGQIAALAQTGPMPLAVNIGIGLLVVGAALKTAAFPLHGWLTEVMEAPTPVSALLHAGIINAGGFLLIRLADLVQTSSGAMAALAMLGGLTALFGATVMLTQSAVKTALAWSTVAQMGFMLLQCGLGLWPLALLHIVAHSLYKAHAFLSSGSAVEEVASVRRPGPVAAPGWKAVARAFAIAIVLYAVVAGGFALLFGSKSPQALALGAILVFGVAYLVAQGLADMVPRALTRRTAVASTGAAIAYFGFHRLADFIWGAGLPNAPVPGALEWALIVVAILSFGLVAVAQTLFPWWAHHPAASGLRVHLANGLYLNAALDRLIGGFKRAQTQ